MQKRTIVLALLAVGVSGCGGGGDTATNTTTPTDPTTVSALVIPATMSVINDSSSTAVAALHANFRAAGAGLSRALSDPATDYSKDKKNSYVYDDSMESMQTVNMILCIMDQMRASDMVNKGDYAVLINNDKCEQGKNQDSSATTGQSSGQTTDLWRWVVNVSRADNSAPQIVKAWSEDEEMGGPGESQRIEVEITVTEGVSSTNPFGKFIMNFKGVNPTTGAVTMKGTLKTETATGGKVAFTFYEVDGTQSSTYSPGEFFFERASSVVTAPDGSDGVAQTISLDEGNFGGGGTQSNSAGYAIAYNATHVLRAGGSNTTKAQLQAMNSTTPGICLSRTNFDTNVWRYDLYHAADGIFNGNSVTAGQRVELNSGFPISYDNAGTSVFGHVGYWGIWLNDPSISLVDGATITKQARGSTAAESYTVVQAPGKLVRSTAKQVLVSKLLGETLTYWGQNPSSSTFGQWQVQYMLNDGGAHPTDGFYIVAEITGHDQNGPITVDLNTHVNVTPTAGNFLGLFSESLGGRVNFVGGSSHVTYYVEEFVNGNDALFAGSDSPVTLNCFQRCLKGGISQTDVDNNLNPDAVFGPNAPNVNTPVTYTISRTDMTLKTVSAPAAVALAAGVTPGSGSSHQWGMNSGEMITADTTINTMGDLYNPTVVSVSYRWETGHNPWNKLTAVKNAAGAFVSFDKPLQFTYDHTTANDANADATYNGKTFRLNYGGNGELWGIPSGPDGNGRWHSDFAIKDGAAMGPTGVEFVIKAREEEKKLKADVGACGALVINQPATPLPTGVDSTFSTFNIGTMPTVTDAPAVIEGEVQL